ncbi:MULTISPECIES: thioredoxin family protein [unclassified Janthinobacterium]|uniref:thioredoxin family protein n=1 Tax=unclassified Janthinobacterium TaxID=2610881 RepID=UPI00160A4873|nr:MULTISPECIES: thioredoxin family protein [unclassified Janthinobacterium]MBB5368692.1 thiol-disulfide isomerase/thioredoxin [Janthinobacterium sp. K2C7]MBB5381772.1 thiol-disulfide isomerase/thioredoxin [Janthinobacterium sp. K2Li3]MBB5387074.1 thiol-disulfide isomerase/thioredoxin [Janthinobacterium sp. K2E3]
MISAIKKLLIAASIVAGSSLAITAHVTQAAPLQDLGQAPALAGIEHWINSPPLNIEQLRGKVVLVDFWTYTCINCVNTLPYVQQWHDKYKGQGLTVIGVHTPEFPFERSTSNVEAATKRLGLTYPIAQDNRYATWRAYRNQYWPAFYLIDKKGRIVYQHFGEGDYAETENTIRALLAQP